MEQVAYIVKNQKNKFKGFVATLVPDEDDSALFVTNFTDKSDNLEEIQQKLKELPPSIKTYMNPIESNRIKRKWIIMAL